MPAFDVTTPDWIIDHKLGTRDLLVQAWQNGFLVQPDVHSISDNKLRIFAYGVTEENPLRVVVLAIETGDTEKPKTAKEQSSASKANSSKVKRTRKSKDS